MFAGSAGCSTSQWGYFKNGRLLKSAHWKVTSAPKGSVTFHGKRSYHGPLASIEDVSKAPPRFQGCPRSDVSEDRPLAFPIAVSFSLPQL